MIPLHAGMPMPESLWAATAIPAPSTTQLTASVHVDVAIVGAGFTGLSTALHLAERGVKVCVIDAGEPGWGASGRNGGQVIPGLKYDPDELVRRFGERQGHALVQTVGGAADTVFDLIDRYGIDCSPVRKGWIQPAHSRKALDVVLKRAAQWRDRGVPTKDLDAREVHARLGTRSFIGGWLDPRAGSVQPLSFTRGLANAALSRNVDIYSRTLATRLSRDAGRWRVETSGGAAVHADRVVLATDGYSGSLWPGLQRTVIAANSFVIATRPLPPELGSAILPGGEVASDSRRLLVYFRRDAQGRLVFGGRGPFREPGAASDWDHLEKAMVLMFPQLKGVAIQHRWAGRIGITQDFLPHVHEPAPGLTIALGYNGRGIAMATTMGKHLAARLTNASHDFPFSITPMRPIPLHGLQRFYITAGVTWYRLLDAVS